MDVVIEELSFKVSSVVHALDFKYSCVRYLSKTAEGETYVECAILKS
jgi:hypothetical protein